MTQDIISFDRVADIYDETRGFPDDVAPRVGAAIFRAGGSGRYLEIGAGTGRIGIPLVEHGADYTGVDISTEMLDRFRAKLANTQRSAHLIEADIQHLPVDDGSFDVIVAVHILHLVPDREKVVDECLRVMTRPGTFVLGTNKQPDDAPHRALWHMWRNEVRALGSDVRRESSNGFDSGLDLLRGRGASVETEIVAEWTTTIIPQVQLDRIRARAYSNSWQLPDEVLNQSVDAAETRARALYGDLSQPLESTSQFLIGVARFS